jgi:putative transposase
MAEALHLSRSGYYAARIRPTSCLERENLFLVEEIRNIHKSTRQVYGSPRMTVELNARGCSCSENRVAQLMKKNGIAAKTKRKFKITTVSKHKFPIAPNLLMQSFIAQGPNQIWASDITYIPTGEGWLYLAMVKDLYSKGIVGWSMQDNLKRDLVIDSFKQAVMQRRPQPGLIFHSDRGVQYACSDFCDLLKKHQVIQSMSGKGNCYDNAVSESFFGTLKTELVYPTRFRTRAEARAAIFDYIEVFYNRQRRHSALGYLSPVEFERRLFIKCA